VTEERRNPEDPFLPLYSLDSLILSYPKKQVMDNMLYILQLSENKYNYDIWFLNSVASSSPIESGQKGNPSGTEQ